MNGMKTTSSPMESLLEELVRFHKEAEEIIARRIAEICRETCSACQTPCCNEHMCSEADDSYFLTRIIGADSRKNSGKWFDGNGCMLQYGRPMLCRDYFCDELLVLAAEKIVPVRQFIKDWKLVYKNFASNRSLLVVGPDAMNTARLEKTLVKSEKFRQKWMPPTS